MPERMSLRLNPVINKYNDYQGVAITPSTVNYGILNDVVNSRIQAKKEASQQATAIDAALGAIEKGLHNDDKTNQWFSDYKQNVKNQITESIDIGNYNQAINTAIRLAGSMETDSALIGRLEANKNYKDWLDKLSKLRLNKDISKDTEEYFIEHNQFNYEDRFDSNGNVIKGNTYENLDIPVKDINIDDYIFKAFKLMTPKKPEATNYTLVNKDGTGISESEEVIYESDIIRNLNEIFRLEPDMEASLWQRYLVESNKYKKLIQQAKENPNDKDISDRLKEYESRVGNGLGVASFEQFCARTLGKSAISNNLAYRYKTKNENNKQSNTEGNVNGKNTPTLDEYGRRKGLGVESNKKQGDYDSHKTPMPGSTPNGGK